MQTLIRHLVRLTASTKLSRHEPLGVGFLNGGPLLFINFRFIIEQVKPRPRVRRLPDPVRSGRDLPGRPPGATWLQPTRYFRENKEDRAPMDYNDVGKTGN